MTSHRPVVQGVRVENPEEAPAVYAMADASRVETAKSAAVLAALLLPLLLALFFLLGKRRR